LCVFRCGIWEAKLLFVLTGGATIQTQARAIPCRRKGLIHGGCVFVDAIIFVVDSADTERLGIAKQELSAMLEVERVALSSALVVLKFVLYRKKISETLFCWCLPTSKINGGRSTHNR
jgi:hypothetical protein